jgi:hypothetical protein
LLGPGKITKRLMIGMSVETHKNVSGLRSRKVWPGKK